MAVNLTRTHLTTLSQKEIYSCPSSFPLIPRNCKLFTNRFCSVSPLLQSRLTTTPKLGASAKLATPEAFNISLESHNNLDFPIMVNGCTGKMGRAVVEAAVKAGLQIIPLLFGSDENSGQIVEVGGTNFHLHGRSEREGVLASVFDAHPVLIVIDYTAPAAVNVGVPFVMGTTGGDTDALYQTVNNSKVYVVISPQMGKQVVAFLVAMEIMAENFLGAFSGYSLKHNVSGRSIYAEGTIDAAVFLAKKVRSKADKRIYNMIDVLREGNMR